jgi:hypothetical protein
MDKINDLRQLEGSDPNANSMPTDRKAILMDGEER